MIIFRKFFMQGHSNKESIKHTDQPQNLADLDWYNTAYLAGQIDEKIFLELLRAKINMSSWFSYIGRYLNTNSSDWTNYVRLRSQTEYNERIARQDSEKVFIDYQSSIDTTKFIPIFNTDIKLSKEQQKLIGFKVSYIHVLRNPFRMYNEWIQTGRISRKTEGNSRIMNVRKRDSGLSVENETADIIIQDHIRSRDSEISVKFEKYCIDPKQTMNDIAKMCDLKLLPFQKEKLHDANVPRDISQESDLSLLISENLSDDRIEILNNLQKEFFKGIA